MKIRRRKLLKIGWATLSLLVLLSMVISLSFRGY